MADELKAEGNKLFAEKKFAESIEKFTQAIALAPQNHVLYSNRSGSYASLKDFDHALQDAEKVIEIKPDWPKGYTRKATAMHGQGDLSGAHVAYDEALKLDPKNAQAKSGLAAVTNAMENAQSNNDPMKTFYNAFKDPNLIQKLASNPKTSHLLANHEFIAKLKKIQSNPQGLSPGDLQDPNILAVFGALMGIDMSFQERPAGSSEGMSQDTEMPDLEPPKSAPKKEAKPEPEFEPDSDDELRAEKKKNKAKADVEKELGTKSYKKRQFDEAIEHYSKAWEIYKDITYLNNLAAVYFEKGDLDKVIETGQQAIKEGKEHYADFKPMAKAYERVGKAYEKKGDRDAAIENYKASLDENRSAEVLTRLRNLEKIKAKEDRESHIDPAKAEEARELGNQKFKEADWPGAVEAYTEMIKSAPNDPRGYSNRAACLIKLLSLPAAVQDCDSAIAADGKFIRAYIRKAQALFAMREYNRCIEVCVEASTHDEGHKNAREIEQQQTKAIEAQFAPKDGETEEQATKRIQDDPEIQKIIQDPVMQSILQQARGDPNALREHMKNPQISIGIQKLIAAGVIRTR